MRDQLFIYFANHSNPDRTAAACQLVILFRLNISGKFQGFFEGQNIRKEGNFDDAVKTDLF
ncbi:hypothetical protein SDC9_172735 [bioreactor metagenome]|uniref:Uncharacterized protein n=1 Tax=bioreactor metagenome TaxID=1076179 RepID=A0A645GGM2_9ZZZZ